METSDSLTVFLPGASWKPPKSRAIRVVKTVAGVESRRSSLLVSVDASQLSSEVARVIHEASRERRLAGLLIRDDVGTAGLVDRLKSVRLRLMRNLVVHSGSGEPQRLLHALQTDHPEQIIVQAFAAGDELVVISGSLERLSVPFEDVPALRELDEAHRHDFDVEEFGAYLHWPEPDVHLDIEALRYIVDPTARAEARKARLAFDEDFGAALAKLRQARGMRQSEFAGLSERQIRRIEKGETLPRTSTLRKVAESLSMSLEELLEEIAKQTQPGTGADGR